MKVLVLNGSPKKKSDTFRMAEAFLRGLNKNQEHEVQIVNVIDKKIAPCRGCFGCWQKGVPGPDNPAGQNGYAPGGERKGTA